MELLFGFLKLLFPQQVLQPFLKPITRLIVGVIAVPFFRTFVRRVARVRDLSEELERDLELWFRGSLLLLAATANMEQQLFGWVPADFQKDWLITAGRLLLAIGVIEGMPDQALFAIIHPGPPKFKMGPQGFVRSILAYIPALLKGLIAQHLNRSSPVLAIMSVFIGGQVGWVCYGMAIGQYLLIGLVTSRDRAVDVLSQFDAVVEERRHDLEAELAKQSHLISERSAAADAVATSNFASAPPVIETERS